MDLSITTDYVTNRGDPGPDLRRIAAAGFTYVHWCHEWNAEDLYLKAAWQATARRQGMVERARAEQATATV